MLPGGGHPVFGLVGHALASGVVFLQNGVDVGRESVDIILSADLLVKKLILIDFSNWGLLSDLLVHHGVSEAGLIELVVAHLSVADQVNDYVLIILLTVLSGKLEGCRDVF